ncbi:hypothetical protein [Erythrobacter sp. AP23]|uniref:hypothetical protein n=1 Tax=Erythrobacter sp. AP23 TaxID=499656 RepID=UPI000830D14D|nr:hypothetical protein [Erythrobacter sp. AP23]
MQMRVSSVFEADPQRVWDLVRRSDTLDFVASPILAFHPHDGAFPETWAGGRYRASLRLFGIIPLGSQTIGIEFPEGAEGMVLRDNGSGHLAKTWDHWIFIRPAPGGRTHYTDRIDVAAGILTPFVLAFARFFYAHRQRRWRRLLRG